MEKNCGNCKYWEPCKDYDTGHGFGLGKCKAAPMFWDATAWDDDGEGRTLLPQYASTLAFVQDGSDYRAWLLTKPAFSCSAHESAPG